MKDPIYKSPADIDMEAAIIDREMARARRALVANIFILLLVMVLIGILFRAGFGTFPRAKTLFTSNAAAVCNFVPVSDPGDLTNVFVADFASTAVVDLHTIDYMNWRKTLDTVTADRFTVEARDAAATALRDSGILPAIIRNQFVLRPVLRDLATVQSSGLVGDTYQWTVSVPVVLAYTGVNASGKAEYRPENRTITVTVSRTPITADHPDGLIISSIQSSQAIADPTTTTAPMPEG